jgi:hypothetical protein
MLNLCSISAEPWIDSSTEVVGGIPQVVYGVPFDVRVADALSRLTFPTKLTLYRGSPRNPGSLARVWPQVS